MPDELSQALTALRKARTQLVAHESTERELQVEAQELQAEREQLLGRGASTSELASVNRRLKGIDRDISRVRRDRGELFDRIGSVSNDLVLLRTPEQLVETLDASIPVAMLPVRIETRFTSQTTVRVRVFPDQVHIDSHEPALTGDEDAAGRWYWTQRWSATDDTDLADQAWRKVTDRFRPGRAAYVVRMMTPTNPIGIGTPDFPATDTRAAPWTRAAEATVLPDRFCVVGLNRDGNGGWVESFREWGSAVPDRIAVGPKPSPSKPDVAAGLPEDDGIAWTRDPKRAKEQGMLIDVSHPSLAGGVDRLLVLGVDWTQTPAQSAAALSALVAAQRDTGQLGFVAQGTPTNNTGQSRSGFTTDPDSAIRDLAPHRAPVAGDTFSAGIRTATAFGLDAAAMSGIPGTDDREHAWSSALTDVLWRATAGYFLSDMLDPIAKDPAIDADLHEFARQHLFAGGPLPTLRVGAQPYGVLPVIAARRFQARAGDQADHLVHKVATAIRELIAGSVDDVPQLRRAGEQQDVETTMLALLQRTPVPWSMRFRPVTGPVQRKFMSKRWDLMAALQHDWAAMLWTKLNQFQVTRVSELTHGKDQSLPVPLVRKAAKDANGIDLPPTAYLKEIADLLFDADGQTALNLRQDSESLLEALAACSAVLDLSRTGLGVIKDEVMAQNPGSLAELVAVSRLAIPTPAMIRVEPELAVARHPLEFISARDLADAVVPSVDPDRTMQAVVASAFLDRWNDVGPSFLHEPTDPYYWLGHQREGLLTLAAAPPDRLEWAFRGWLDLLSSRLDAWFTGLAHHRLQVNRQSSPTGVHIGCWGWVEDLRHDTGLAAESVGFVHTPSLAHAASTALLRNGRLANRADDGALFDLQLTSDRVRRAQWVLDGVAQGQRLAALLGYRIERRLRESGPTVEAGLAMMRYQLPLRRTAPLRGPDVQPDEPVEALAARDVVDGVAILDRWHLDPSAVLADVAAQCGLASLPSGDAASLRAVLDDVYSTYDSVSDVLVAEAVHQAAAGNLERSGAALAAHDRHAAAPELDYIATPRAGHTITHKVGVLLQDEAVPVGWIRDARGAAEPLLDNWVARLLGKPADWLFTARVVAADGTTTMLSPVSLRELGMGALSTVLATQRPSSGGPTELEHRLGLVFSAQAAADPESRLELLADGVGGNGGLAMFSTICDWAAKIAGAPALTASDFASSADVSVGMPSPGAPDLAELAARAAEALSTLDDVIIGLDATTPADLSNALLDAVAFDGPDAIPQVPLGHAEAAAVLAAQAAAVTERLNERRTQSHALAARPLPALDEGTVIHHKDVIQALLGHGQPVLARWTLTDAAPASASLGDRSALLRADPTATASWLHRSALVREPLDALGSLLMHVEARGEDVCGQLSIVQQPHRPGTGWIALPFGEDGTPPHGVLGLVLHSWKPIAAAKPFAGVMVDGWTETLPAAKETTAVTFHYDAPGARAPQAVLLAVHPSIQPTTWDFATLLDTVNEAADLAQLRTLSAKEYAPLASFLPAIYLPDDYTRDVPSVPLRDMFAKFAANNVDRIADVIGKG